ncbi:xyloside xylosyltransferase 1 [Agrilus planipennis]|uniref:Xyloside xylosyltransferase 1 n=1 Tax=Agrilus planipennis TaxID=224129 RepID=A0A1W4WQI1_AGRPL|nr:xyloside xylosyltransferase 1 [Agrilus planipennis]
MLKTKFSFKVLLLAAILIFTVYVFLYDKTSAQVLNKLNDVPKNAERTSTTLFKRDPEYNLWLVFTRTTKHSTLTYKFEHLITNLLNISKVPLNVHIVVDNNSKSIAEEIILEKCRQANRTIRYDFYNITTTAALIDDIVQVMSPHFSSKPGTYYSGALFYLSLGLYRFAPINETTAIMLDCDLYFKDDINLLFHQFQSFNSSVLFGLAPELSPVYRHILTKYRMNHKTPFGEYYHSYELFNSNHSHGFQGYNTGVILLNITAIRNSKEYLNLISSEYVGNLTQKYKFKGHLGDQDFYTLLGYERPDLFKTLSCGFNRQLCTWWKDHGYSDVFKHYFKCNEHITVLHGNCHSKIPNSK